MSKMQRPKSLEIPLSEKHLFLAGHTRFQFAHDMNVYRACAKVLAWFQVVYL